MKFFDWILDKSILFSFDRSGYLRHQRHFQNESFSSEGLRALVTGASRGIGQAAAQALRRADCQTETIARTKPADHQLDMSSKKAIRAFVSTLSSKKYNLLIHNAGSMPNQFTQTDEGLELTWATHVVGPYFLTKLLHEYGFLADNARIIFITSGGMYLQPLDLTQPLFNKKSYDKYKAYANAKRAQVMLVEKLAKQFPNYKISAMHPGWVKTQGVKNSLPSFYKWMKNRLRTPEQGADTIIYLALSTKPYPSGKLWFDRKQVPIHLIKKTKSSDMLIEDLMTRLEEEICS